MKLTVEVEVNIGGWGAVARHRDEITVSIGDAVQMLADDPLGFVQIIRRFSEGQVTPDSGLDAEQFGLLCAMRPGLVLAHAAAFARWKGTLEGPK